MNCFEKLVLHPIKTSLPPSLDPLQFAYRAKRSTLDAIAAWKSGQSFSVVEDILPGSGPKKYHPSALCQYRLVALTFYIIKVLENCYGLISISK